MSGNPDKSAPLRALLLNVSIFEELDDEARQQVVDKARVVRLRAGEWLFRQGGLGTALYLVAAGRLEIINESHGTPRLVTMLGPGECVGELALLCDLPRSASVRARRDCELLEVSREVFDDLMRRDARLAIAMTRVLATRLHRTSAFTAQGGRSRIRVLSLVPMHPGLPLSEIREALVATFGAFARVAVLDGDEVDVTGLDADRADHAYARALDRAEDTHDVVLLLAADAATATASGPGSPWTRFCLRQGDRHVLLAWAHGEPTLAARFGHLDAPDIALFGPRPRRGSVAPWLEAVSPRAHYLVLDEDRPRCLARMARRLAGRAVGVVLSGGGARGFAHIGVLEGLRERGVVIDRIGGTSMGAMMGALFAAGRDPREINALCLREIQRPFNDYTFPLLSLTRGSKALRMLERVFGDLRIEELPIDLFCLSADLLTATPYIHRDGLIAEAIACSAALPGLAPPRRFRDRLLVDGALLNNLPTDVMAATHEGPVIASDVMAKRDRPTTDGLLPGVRPPPRWLTSMTRFLGTQPGPLPTIVQTLMRASVLGSVSAATTQRGIAEVVIMPPVSHIGLLEFDRSAELFEVGRAAALQMADEHGLVGGPPAAAPDAGRGNL